MIKTRNTVLWGVAIALLGGGKLLAGPLISSLQIGAQAPDPVSPGGSASYTITVTKTNSGGMSVNLSALNLPVGAKATFSPNPLDFGNSTLVATSTLVISTTNTLPVGDYAFKVWGQDGGNPNAKTNSATLDVGLRPACLAQMTNGCWCYTFPTQPGLTYQVQATTNLSSHAWTTLCTTNCGTNYLLTFLDTDKSFYSCRFYRAVGQ